MATALAGEDFVRSGRSMNWRAEELWNDQPDTFQRSGRKKEEEEEELRWAAIERLPTDDRLKKGMLKQVRSDGRIEHDEVDVTELGTDDKKKMMDSILKVVEDDNEKFLRKLRDRTDRVGHEVPELEVRFQNLTVEGDPYVIMSEQEHFQLYTIPP